MTRRVVLACTGYGQSGARYRVMDEDGRVLVANSRNPEFDAARTLLSAGITGRLEVWRAAASYPSSTLDIEQAAGLTVVEGANTGPTIRPWQTFKEGDRLQSLGAPLE